MKAGRAQVENLPDGNVPIVKKHKKKVLVFSPLTWGGCLSQSEKKGEKMFETCDGKSICIALTGKKDYIVLDYIVWRVDGAGDSDTINLCFTFFLEKNPNNMRLDTVDLTLLDNKDKRQARDSRQEKLPAAVVTELNLSEHHIRRRPLWKDRMKLWNTEQVHVLVVVQQWSVDTKASFLNYSGSLFLMKIDEKACKCFSCYI